MQSSVVNYQKVKENPDFRIDGEYFRPIFLVLEEKLIGGFVLNNALEYLTDGTHQTPQYTGEGVPFLSSGNIEPNYIDFDNTKYISEREHSLLKHCQPKAFDILISKSGRIGHAAVVPEGYIKGDFNIYEGIALLRIKGIDPFALSTIINSEIAQKQIERLHKGVAQPHLHLEDVRNIKIPSFSEGFLKELSFISLEVVVERGRARSLYSQAEEVLLAELGLAEWKSREELAFVKKYSQMQKANRFDADYFQHKYEEIVSAIKKYKGGFDELGNLVKVKDKNFTPKDDEQYKYIELANISSNGEINGYSESVSTELPSRARRKVQAGDVVVSSIEGSLESIALVPDDLNNALCSTGFYVIRSDELNAETLLVLLKTKVGQLQLKKGCSGTILTAIGKDEFTRVILPKVALAVQEQVKEKIGEMYKAKHRSKTLLYIAKRGVELAIEKDEKTAEKWIDEQTEKLNLARI